MRERRGMKKLLTTEDFPGDDLLHPGKSRMAMSRYSSHETFQVVLISSPSCYRRQ